MHEDTLIRETVATIVITLVDVCRNGGDVERITAGLLGEFDMLLETPERAARALLTFASLSADALAHSTDVLLPNREDPRSLLPADATR